MVLTDQGILTPYPVCIHNLNHVSVFPLTLRLSCLPLCWPVLAYSSLTPYLTWCVDLSTYVILSFCDFVYCQVAPIIFCFFYQSFFNSPPPRVLSLTFHFSLYSSPFLTSFSSLLHLPVCFLSPCVASVSVRPYG